MKFGASMFFTDYSMAPGELAVALEQRGFDIIWAPEHSHIPASRKTPFVLGGDLPKRYYDVMDPFVTLTAAAIYETATTDEAPIVRKRSSASSATIRLSSRSNTLRPSNGLGFVLESDVSPTRDGRRSAPSSVTRAAGARCSSGMRNSASRPVGAYDTEAVP